MERYLLLMTAVNLLGAFISVTSTISILRIRGRTGEVGGQVSGGAPQVSGGSRTSSPVGSVQEPNMTQFANSVRWPYLYLLEKILPYVMGASCKYRGHSEACGSVGCCDWTDFTEWILIVLDRKGEIIDRHQEERHHGE